MKREILVIDDDEGVLWVLQRALTPLGYSVTATSSIKAGLKAVNGAPIVLLDLKLPDGSGLDALSKIKSLSPETNVIIITAYGRMEDTIGAMKAGAFDYIEKPFDIEELKITVEKAWKDIGIRSELKRLKADCSDNGAPQMIGKSRKMIKVFKDIGRIAAKDVTILITGESGTGKELVAKAIHHNSPRKAGAFIAINSASIPKDLLESELFGWKQGAFTGAKESRTGSVGAADGGTLFLDEICEMDINLQAKLLRFMQEREYSPLGSNEVLKSDARVIGATNRNLKEAVKKGLFREDLYYRFHVVEIKLPSLRERKEDILPLAEEFLKRSVVKYDTGYKEFSKESMETMLHYDWPGNVRELENAVKRAAILSTGGTMERKDLLLNDFSTNSVEEFLEEKLSRYLNEISKLEAGNLYGMIIAEFERSLIKIVLRETKWNQIHAARTLGINRNTLRSKIRQYGLAQYK